MVRGSHRQPQRWQVSELPRLRAEVTALEQSRKTTEAREKYYDEREYMNELEWTAAGVSVATVSRVVNGTATVREETKQRVEEEIARLRYAPHAAARSLITNRTSTIGVVLPDIWGEYFSEVIRGVDVAARQAGYHVLVSSSHSRRNDAGSSQIPRQRSQRCASMEPEEATERATLQSGQERVP